MNEIYIIERLLASETLNPETIEALETAQKCIRIVGLEIEAENLKQKVRGEEK